MHRYRSSAGISNLMDGSGPFKCLDELIYFILFYFLVIRKILFEERLLNAKRSQSSKDVQIKGKTKTQPWSRKKQIYKHQKRITRCESPSPRPIKQRNHKQGKELIPWTLHIFKFAIITLPSNPWHQTQQCQIPNIIWMPLLVKRKRLQMF